MADNPLWYLPSSSSLAESSASSSQVNYNVGDYVQASDGYDTLNGIIFLKSHHPYSYDYYIYVKKNGGIKRILTDRISKLITRQEFEKGFIPNQEFIDVYNDLLSRTGQTPYVPTVPTTDGRRKSHRRKSHRRKSHRRKSHRRKSHRRKSHRRKSHRI
jgi:hypothetical protein